MRNDCHLSNTVLANKKKITHTIHTIMENELWSVKCIATKLFWVNGKHEKRYQIEEKNIKELRIITESSIMLK